ncbi:MAG: hypothetical protein ABIT83_18520, partial [Massilia sp.]
RPQRASAQPPGVLDAAGARAAGAALTEALARGALDDAALAALAASLGPQAAPRLTALRNAIDDFDFSLAQDQLDTLLAHAATATA